MTLPATKQALVRSITLQTMMRMRLQLQVGLRVAVLLLISHADFAFLISKCASGQRFC